MRRAFTWPWPFKGTKGQHTTSLLRDRAIASAIRACQGDWVPPMTLLAAPEARWARNARVTAFDPLLPFADSGRASAVQREAAVRHSVEAVLNRPQEKPADLYLGAQLSPQGRQSLTREEYGGVVTGWHCSYGCPEPGRFRATPLKRVESCSIRELRWSLELRLWPIQIAY